MRCLEFQIASDHELDEQFLQYFRREELFYALVEVSENFQDSLVRENRAKPLLLFWLTLHKLVDESHY